MDAFFSGLDPQSALQMAELSKSGYALREYRKQILTESGCADAAELMAAVQEGRVPEHPGYERWLAAVLMQRRERAIRTELERRCGQPEADASALAIDHPLVEVLAEIEVPARFSQEIRLHPDGITLADEQGLEVLVRMVSPGHWSFEWCVGQAVWRLDTAPVCHPGITTHAHLHRPDGSVVADPLDLDAADMPGVLQRVLDALAGSHEL